MRQVTGTLLKETWKKAKTNKKRPFVSWERKPELSMPVSSTDFKERISYFYKRQDLTVYKEVIFFLMETKTTDVKLSFEHIGFEWLTYEGAMRKLTFKNARDVLQTSPCFSAKAGN